MRLVSFCKDNTISCSNNTISCFFILFDNQHFTIFIKYIYHFMYFVLDIYISLTYKLITMYIHSLDNNEISFINQTARDYDLDFFLVKQYYFKYYKESVIVFYDELEKIIQINKQL